ncbi:hypothetical protein FZEAL_8914 [Fusarium zealandicum]|uniref:DUF3835 domain-containing protein n=1 Tax=Fusarium zealandicum TaxID=1053134 RepID=A0A8H4UDI0_9HYPO|nr:hypothetical protein FZEAL_8914 [Fusarium zealandicum]
MSGGKDSFTDLERHRTQLEENVNQLQKALQHWQTWDAEYEALKEEVDAVCKTSGTELATIQVGFEGELLNSREIDEIFGGKEQKSKEQIINVLERRIDYVTKNIESLQKQIETAETKLAAATVISQPDATDEEGLPITEIVEQLDDEDNVVSYQLNKPGDSVPRVQEALKKAGVTDLEEDEPSSKEGFPTQKEPEASQQSASQQPAVETIPSTSRVKESLQAELPTSKGVSFAADTKVQDGPAPQVTWKAKRVEQIMKDAKEQEKLSNEQPFIPEDEDDEDAELRRQMLEYSGEVGAVVAELQLEEGDSDDDDYDYDFDEGFEDEDQDEEDKYGRTTSRVVTDTYRQRMLELEKKLGVKSRFTENVNDEDDDQEEPDDEGIGRIVVKQSREPASSASKPAPIKSNIREKQPAPANGKKGVHFASSLDVSPVDEPVALPVREAPVKEKEPLVEPLSDVVERSGPAKAPDTKSSRKPSRFKKTRDTGVPPGPLDAPAKFMDQDRPTAPTGPEGTTMADTLVERDSSAAPRMPDEFDDDMIHDEVADEYQRMRKKFIQREGGFLKEDESPIQPLDEADGGKERVSRFRSARLSKH